MANNKLIDTFNEYFEMVPAISDDLKNEVYKLRYQVYCIENHFEYPNQFPDQMEFDNFDQNSLHYLIRHRRSGEYAATTRLILPGANNPEKLFPLELHCEIDNFAVIKPINRAHLAEISRFCVSKAFKKRKHETHALAPSSSDWQNCSTLEERRTFPHLTLALIACFIKASYENDIHYLYATIEPSLLRFVSSAWNINFTKIGPLTNYHGERWPSVIKVADLLDGVAEKDLEIWNMLTNKGAFWPTRLIDKRVSHSAREHTSVDGLLKPPTSPVPF